MPKQDREPNTTSDVLIKCRFCGRRFQGAGGELRNDGIILGECGHCKEVFIDLIHRRETEARIDELTNLLNNQPWERIFPHGSLTAPMLHPDQQEYLKERINHLKEQNND